ncbi:Pur regulon 18 kDa protein [Legionella massiliensis]|uniref:Pur regulon 18 kDa protein n=1 Tax=Legionella massiliensis TaxID=1034943 RepID=A0A078KV92_9GAMM|nr:CvpA family protein [Legionella massiliensis]CDZ78360.1 Pur regulon 18 kDa protein [Legionella massiliensis]CEE14098.1 Colicin V production protein [Legionella massiliensis]
MAYWVDLAILAIIGLSVLTGLVRGFVKELIALAVWILAFWLAFEYSQGLYPWLQKYIQDKTAIMATAFILVLLGTLIAGGIVNAVLGFILKRSGLSGTDRILGMGFGFVRGVFIVALIMVVIKLTSLPHEEYSKESKLYAKFDPLVGWLSASMPDFIKKAKLFEKEHTPATAATPTKSTPQKVGNTSMVYMPGDYELSDG